MNEKCTSINQEACNADTLGFMLCPGTELRQDQESQRLCLWQETGEATGPTVIGRLNISSEIVDIIAAARWSDYGPFDIRDIDTEAEVTPEVLQTLHALWGVLNGAVYKDLERSGYASAEFIWDSIVSCGQYKSSDDMEVPHYDYPDQPRTIRYCVTILGPSTNFYTGQISPANFDDEGTAVGPLPDDVNTIHYPELTVVRFMAATDIHSAPLPKSEPRIFIDFTIEPISLDE